MQDSHKMDKFAIVVLQLLFFHCCKLEPISWVVILDQNKFAIVVLQLLLLTWRRVFATVVKVVNQSVSNVEPLRQCGRSGGA